MAGWNDILNELTALGGAHDVVRRKYLKELHEYTKRNVIVYYSGWLQKRHLADQGVQFGINDLDKNGFMACINKLDRSKGLDLILHTPGGGAAATESLVDYLRAMFDTDIRAIIPQMAMSAGTMIALSCKEIVMGKHSSLGPIDPQISGLPAHGIIEEFNRAVEDIGNNRDVMIPVWQPIIAKYSPALIGECEKAIDWSERMVKEWLTTGMLKDREDREEKAEKIIKEFGDHSLTLSHDRHISIEKVSACDINTTWLENDGKLQDLVLSVHHICMQTLMDTPAIKIIENQIGVAQLMSVKIAQ